MLDIEQIINQVMDWVWAYLPIVIGAIAVLVVGWIAIGWVTQRLHLYFQKAEFDPAVETFMESLANIALKVVLLVIVISMLGVKTTSLVAVLGAMTLAVGLALQGSLANFAGGVLILIFKPFRVGDFIEAQGEMGTVKKIEIFNTILATSDNKKVVLPNGNLANDVMVNFSFASTRRHDIIIGIGYQDDVNKAKSIIEKLLASNELVHQDPEPTVGVSELGASSVNIQVRFWVDSDEYLGAKYWFLESLKQQFDEQGVSIPFPQMDVHIENTN